MMTADELPRPKVRHPEVSPTAEYRLLRVVVTAITLGRTMVLAENDATDPDVVLAQGRMDEALTEFTKHLKALETIAADQLAASDIAGGLRSLMGMADSNTATVNNQRSNYTSSPEGRAP